MSEFSNGRVMTVGLSSSEDDAGPVQVQVRKRAGSGLAPVAVLEKIQELFQICDSEDKGYITPTDMTKLHGELPLTAEELENVFDSLDSDRNGCLTLEEFSSGFSDFLSGRKVSLTQDQMTDLSQNVPEVLYQDEPQAGNEDEEERHFSLLMERLGASNVLKDHSEVHSLWAQLQNNEPHLLSSFEEFLAQVTSQIRQERKEMENALRMKAATHDGEIRRLYEEMEQEINTEKDRLLLKDSTTLSCLQDSERVQLHSQDLEHQLNCKEQELERICLRQRRLEQQHRESQVENIKLKMTNEELSRELENTCHELSLAQEQLAILEEKAVRLQEEREMEIYRITEGLQREKQSLIKQLDLLREMNKHLRDERDINSMKQSSMQKFTHKQEAALITSVKNSETKPSTTRDTSMEEVTQPSSRKSLTNGRAIHSSTRADGKARAAKHAPKAGWAPAAMSMGLDGRDAPLEAWPFHRVISIEEDHLPNLLQGDPHLLLHQLAEEEERRGQEEDQPDLEMHHTNMSLASVDSAPLVQGQMQFSIQKGGEGSVPALSRAQPVGKEALQKGPEEGIPECFFKVIFVGNSSVGKTALLRRFCDDQFHPTTVTVGLDYCVRTLNLGDRHVTLQLWDTAGQERYRSITQQFFRKADGVVLIYDVTTPDSFSAVHSWLASIQDAVRGPIPILLLGNKSDKEGLREVPAKAGERLAQEASLMFYECSAYTGHNVLEAMLQLARVMREQEDRVCESTVLLVEKPTKKKACCS